MESWLVVLHKWKRGISVDRKQVEERCKDCKHFTMADDFLGGTEPYCTAMGYPCDMVKYINCPLKETLEKKG